MRSLNSFAFATVVAALLLFIVVTQPVAAGLISGTSSDVLLRPASRASDSWRAIGELLDCNSRLTKTGDTVKSDTELGNAVSGSDGTHDLTLALLNGELDMHRAATSRALEKSGSWINSAVPTPAIGPAAPLRTQDLGLSTGNLWHFAESLLSRITEYNDPSGGEQSDSATDSDRHPKIVAASEPGQLAYVIGAGAIGSAWQRRRVRRRRQQSAA